MDFSWKRSCSPFVEFSTGFLSKGLSHSTLHLPLLTATIQYHTCRKTVWHTRPNSIQYPCTNAFYGWCVTHYNQIDLSTASALWVLLEVSRMTETGEWLWPTPFQVECTPFNDENILQPRNSTMQQLSIRAINVDSNGMTSQHVKS